MPRIQKSNSDTNLFLKPSTTFLYHHTTFQFFLSINVRKELSGSRSLRCAQQVEHITSTINGPCLFTNIIFVVHVLSKRNILFKFPSAVRGYCSDKFLRPHTFCDRPYLHNQKQVLRKLEPRKWIWPISWLQRCTGGKERGLFKRAGDGLPRFDVSSLCTVTLVWYTDADRLPFPVFSST